MLVKYVGESAGRVIVIPGGVVSAEKGEPVDVPDDVAASLLEQDGWEKVVKRGHAADSGDDT